VVSPESPDVELSLEPNANPAAKSFQEAMFKQGIPLAAFEVEDIEQETIRCRRESLRFLTLDADPAPGLLGGLERILSGILDCAGPLGPRNPETATRQPPSGPCADRWRTHS
jgi:glyoxylase I family protein